MIHSNYKLLCLPVYSLYTYIPQIDFITWLNKLVNNLVCICDYICMGEFITYAECISVFVILLALMGALVNSMVHSIMYTYYGLTAFGPSVRKYIGKYKKRVTQLQLVRPKPLYVCIYIILLLWRM